MGFEMNGRELTHGNRQKPRPADELEREDQCLQGCIGDLEKSDKDLFERYLKEKGGLASLLVRIGRRTQPDPKCLENSRAHRIRKKMRKCMEECIKRAETK
jgi:hypothetical protein